jgi:23S rRNA pseudouridine1911/1915/1917 synthase
MNGETFSATAQNPGRLDQFLSEALAERGAARARIQEWIKDGHATVDGKPVAKPSHKLRGGEAVSLAIPEAKSAPAPEEGDVVVLYRDEHLAVVDKPPGLTVHPAPSCPEGTLVNRLLRHFPELAEVGGERPGIVHRIDKDTSGLLAVALTEPARLAMSAAFAGREVKKTYLALLHGRPGKDAGHIDAPMGRDPAHKTRMAAIRGGREALTDWRVVWSAPDKSSCLAEVDIHTGRTHQIRVHMAHIGHPLLGDQLYGPARQADLKRRDPLLYTLAPRQMLHAWKLTLTHPDSAVDPEGQTGDGRGRELSFTLPPPRDFWRIPLHLERAVQRVGVVGLPGSGKSAVCDALKRRGCPVFSADACVAGLYKPGSDGWSMLRARYGDRFTPHGGAPVDKAALLAAMRASESFRRELMELLYPMVQNRLEEFWRRHLRARAAFAEVPMLLEAGWQGRGIVDFAVCVDAPGDVRHTRLASERGWDEALIALVDSWQWPREKKLAACRHVIENASGLDAVERQVDALLAKLRRERIGRAKALMAWMRGREYAS